MGIKSLSNSSGIVNFQKYQSFLAGTESNQFHHLETVRLSGTTASVTFSNLQEYHDYQHLQIRVVARTDRSATNDNVILRFNDDSGTNYSTHNLRGSGGSVTSGAGANDTKIICRAVGGNGDFGATVIDILDPFETTKNTSVRSLGGYATDIVELGSGSWRNTGAVTSILLDQDVGSNFLAGSRFSLYGLKARR